jgi:CRISPR-associated protein Cmr2
VKYLLSLSLGPVQEFIAAARRTRDLRFGSVLLSELSKAVARRIRKDHPEALIFPFSNTPDPDLVAGSAYTVSNRILASIEAPDEPAVSRYADLLEKTARDHLLAIGENALTQAGRLVGANAEAIDEGLAVTQLGTLTEYYAAWMPYEEDGYGAARSGVEVLAAARKTLRNFNPHAGCRLPKSSLDGIRETVIRKNGLRKDQFFVKPNEQLDGIGIIKRFGGEAMRFDSTIDVAAGPYLCRLSQTHRKQLKSYEDFLRAHEKDIPFSYGYLYRHESRGPAELGEPFAGELDRLLKGLEIPEPKPPYYAFFLGDGDSMGDALSSVRTIAEHRELSGRLSEFSIEVGKLADRHKHWNVVFAGGDDVMALLPLHEALDAAARFRECFARAVKGLPKAPTFSAGMVIAHALAPLSEVRHLAKLAERQAKRMEDKNAIAIHAVPRSGVPVAVCGYWDRIEPELNSAIELYRDRAISPGFAYALRDLLNSTARYEHLDEVLFSMARALAEKKEAKKQFLDRLEQIGQRIAAPAPKQTARQELQSLCNLLLVTRPIARAMREAKA